LLQPEVRFHTAAAIEEHHDRNRLNVAAEQRERLRLAVVVDAELASLQIGDEPPLRVRDRRIHGNQRRAALEGWSRLLREQRSGAPRRNGRHADRSMPSHEWSSTVAGTSMIRQTADSA